MCREFGLRKDADEFVDLKAPACGSWQCPECAPRRKRALIAMVLDGRGTRFVTFTLRRSPGASPDKAADFLMLSWDVFLKWLRRHHKGHEVEALSVVEMTKQGWPHLHVALRMPYTSQAILKKKWEQLTGSHQVKIKLIRQASKVAYYFAKYIGKAPARFGKHKRYFMTRKWLLNWTRAEKHRPLLGEARWYRVDGTIIEAAHMLVSQAHWPDVISERHTRLWKPGHWPERAYGL